MKIFRTGPFTVVKEYQRNFNFLPMESQLEIRTAEFLQAFSATKKRHTLLLVVQTACSLSRSSSSLMVYLVNTVQNRDTRV